MKAFLIYCFAFTNMLSNAQISNTEPTSINIRLSFLVFPTVSPLLTLEVRTIDKLTLQVETNFNNTHGINIKYFTKQVMNGHCFFAGTAFLESDYLRKDKKTTYLPYLGYGYAHRFGKKTHWIFDNRLGIGRTLNADKNIITPVFKTGIGRTF